MVMLLVAEEDEVVAVEFDRVVQRNAQVFRPTDVLRIPAVHEIPDGAELSFPSVEAAPRFITNSALGGQRFWRAEEPRGSLCDAEEGNRCSIRREADRVDFLRNVEGIGESG